MEGAEHQHPPIGGRLCDGGLQRRPDIGMTFGGGSRSAGQPQCERIHVLPAEDAAIGVDTPEDVPQAEAALRAAGLA